MDAFSDQPSAFSQIPKKQPATVNDPTGNADGGDSGKAIFWKTGISVWKKAGENYYGGDKIIFQAATATKLESSKQQVTAKNQPLDAGSRQFINPAR